MELRERLTRAEAAIEYGLSEQSKRISVVDRQIVRLCERTSDLERNERHLNRAMGQAQRALHDNTRFRRQVEQYISNSGVIAAAVKYILVASVPIVIASGIISKDNIDGLTAWLGLL